MSVLDSGTRKNSCMTQESSPLEQFQTYSRQLSDLRSASSLLNWDQETKMPPRGVADRAGQAATLARLYHQRLVSDRYRDLMEQAESHSDDPWTQADVREARRLHGKATKLPPTLVSELARTTSLAFDAWTSARQASDFTSFAPWLTRIVALKRQEAECLQIGQTRYDALLDEYEPGAREADLHRVFCRLRPLLTDLLGRLLASRKQPPPNLLKGHYPIAEQKRFGRQVLTAMGFDWDSGRLDQSPHPFCSGLSPRDVRITTRYNEEDFGVAIFGMIHEAGHGLYEQGLDSERHGLPATSSISLGIHESQSRLWENLVGRSRGFWQHWYPLLQEAFPGQFDGLPLDGFLGGINRVDAGLIRVEADEVSYGLHVILRFELERELLAGNLEADELETRWNLLMEDFLGIRPPDAATGVLQDVHWSSGLFGYFPTYLIGTMYATQFYLQALKELPDLEESIAGGDLSQLREWLRDRIHLQGKLYQAEELVQQVTGTILSDSQFVDYLTWKYERLYDI